MKKILGILFLILLAAGCGKEFPRSGVYDRTLIFYLAANNSLEGELDRDIQQVTASATREMLKDNAILIFMRGRSEATLSKVVFDRNGNPSREVIKSYGSVSAADWHTLNMVVKDAGRLAPATTYGLVLSSHATAWLPAGTTGPRRAFGQDGSNWMELDEVAMALPDNMFDVILFDACYMGSVEVAYELRDKSRYMIASPAEIISEGMPYNHILSHLISTDNNFSKLCELFMDYYRKYTYPYATIALYDCSRLDALADVVSHIVSQYGSGLPQMSYNTTQRYDRNYSQYWAFDLLEMLKQMIPVDDVAYSDLIVALSAAVVYKDALPNNFAGYPDVLPPGGPVIDPARYSGMSMFNPSLPEYAGTWRKEFYEGLSWYRRVYPQP